jgi:hypothetical protein
VSWCQRVRAGKGGESTAVTRARRALTSAAAAALLALITSCTGSSGAPHRQGGPSQPPAGGAGSPPSHPDGKALVPLTSPSCHPGTNAAEFWMIQRKELGELAGSTPWAVRHAINYRNLFTLGQPGAATGPGQAVSVFKSYTKFSQAISDGSIPRTTRWVLYDNETWPATPVTEQLHPWRYEALFARLAHHHGYRVILAPGQDLVLKFPPERPMPAQAPWQRYLSLGLAKASATQADIYEIQAQSDELPSYRKSGTYRRFVRAAAAQAQAANPRVTVFAGISTARVGSMQEMLSDYLSVRGLVSGIWLNVPGAGEPRQRAFAAKVLTRVPGRAGAIGRVCASRQGPPSGGSVAGRGGSVVTAGESGTARHGRAGTAWQALASREGQPDPG